MTDTDTLPPAAPDAPATPEPAPAPEPAKPADKPAKADPAPAKPADQPADKPKTVLEAPADDAPAPADFPDDWREKLAGDDAKMLATLKRFTSPKSFSDSYFALKHKMSSGEYRKALPENATDDQVAEWRKENGIPENPDGYDTALPDGLVIGEDDKPLVGEFLTSMHAANAQPGAVKAALATYYKLVEKQAADQAAKDADYHSASDDALRAEWGGDYRKNVNAVSALLDLAPSGMKDSLMAARLGDGTKLGDNPDALRWLAGLAREVNPAAAVVPGAGANAAGAISDELATLKAKMGDHASDYWQGPNARRNQERYRELLSAQDRLKARA